MLNIDLYIKKIFVVQVSVINKPSRSLNYQAGPFEQEN
jgi:hypothetical protein